MTTRRDLRNDPSRLFATRWAGKRLFMPHYIHPRWTLEAEVVRNGVQMYATDEIDWRRIYDFNPATGAHSPGLPEEVRTRLLELLQVYSIEAFAFSTWLFKWDSKDHAFEISTGDWDPRDR